jgi:general secretion pathway protein G
LLIENGNYTAAITNTNSVSGAAGDITIGQLAQRSLAALRKFFPRVVFSTSGTVPTTLKRWYDFNGNGVIDSAYILQGHECLVFFLGGIPTPDPLPLNGAIPSRFAMSGFGKDPTNPFSNTIASDPGLPNQTAGQPNSMYSANRQPPLFEFSNNRLVLDPNATDVNSHLMTIPGYLDSLGNAPPPPPILDPTTGVVQAQQLDQLNFYAYFSAYGSGGYDANDVNFTETDANRSPPVLNFAVGFPVVGTGAYPPCISLIPNPYTSNVTAGGSAVASFLNPQSFQIISSGADGQYGVGGQYQPDNPNGSLPLDLTNLGGTTDHGLRARERDNVTNFHNGKLQ